MKFHQKLARATKKVNYENVDVWRKTRARIYVAGKIGECVCMSVSLTHMHVHPHIWHICTHEYEM